MAVRFNANGENLQQNDLVSAVNYNDSYTLMVWYYSVAIHATVNLGFLWMSNTAITAYDVIGQESVSNGSQLYIGDNVSGFDYSAGAMSDGAWNHIAMVRTNSALLQGFLNGAQFGTNRTGSVAARAAATRTWIGNPSGSYYNSARFAHAKLWRVPLTPDDIQREMWSIAPVTNLRDVVSWWPLMSDNRRLGANGYSWTENGTLSDEADPEIAWRIAPPRPMFWWIPPPAATSIIPQVRQHMQQQNMA